MQTVSPQTSTTAMSDGDLLRAYVESKDQTAFTLLIERHAAMIHGVCRRVLGSDSHADDLVQAVSLLLFRKANELSGRSDIAGWVHNAARYCAFNIRSRQFRHERLTREVQQDQAAAVASPNSELSPWYGARDELDQALSEIPERYHMALVLHYFEGLPYEEVARRIGSPLASVRTLMQRGRERLRKKLANRGVALSMVALVAGLESEGGELPLAACRLPMGESPELPEEVRAIADTVMVEMDQTAARATWRKVGGVAAGLATIGVGTALVANYLQPVQVPSGETTAWRIESVAGSPLARRAGTMQTLKAGDPLCMGDTIVTSSNEEIRAVSELGDRVLLREEGEIEVGGRRSEDSARRSDAFFLGKGAIVAQVKRPTCFVTPHAGVETDGADFFLMVANGLTTNDAPWSFSRVDVTEGSAKFLPSSISNLKSEIPLVAGQTVCAGTDRVGRPIKTLARKSDGREMSPKYGGIVFREYAELYDSRESGLHAMRFREGPVLLETNAWQMADKVIVKGDLRVAPRVAKTGEKGLGFETGATGRGGGIFPLGLPTADVFEIRVEYAFAGTFKKEGRFDIAVYPVDLVRLPIHSLPRNGRNIPSGKNEGDLWGVYRMKFLRIGAAPEGQPVYETDLLDTLTDIIVTHTTVLDTEKWGPSMFVQWMRIRVGAIRIVELCEERRLR